MRIPVASEAGQASVEFAALLPLAAVLALALWQVAVAGYAEWISGGAARAAARAAAVGGDPLAAARRVLPAALEPGLRVERRSGGGVRLTLRIPVVVGGGHLGTIGQSARLPPQGR
jgi:hypothetical protein